MSFTDIRVIAFTVLLWNLHWTDFINLCRFIKSDAATMMERILSAIKFTVDSEVVFLQLNKILNQEPIKCCWV
jgi:hypothetical protein